MNEQLDKPVRAPRWGYGKPAHARMAALLERDRPRYARTLRAFREHKDLFHSVPHRPESATGPHWRNPFFSTFDAVALMGFLSVRNPARYVEIGSGNSTKFARHTVEAAKLQTVITSIDPQPRAEIDAICDEVVRSPLQDCDLDLFQDLRPGDILFFDGSHKCDLNSDVTVFFLEILPILARGVLVQVHDVFWPLDYAPEFLNRNYDEQYVLGSILLGSPEAYDVAMPNYFVCQHPELSGEVRSLLAGPGPQDIPFHYKNVPHMTALSFWFEKAGGAEARAP